MKLSSTIYALPAVFVGICLVALFFFEQPKYSSANAVTATNIGTATTSTAVAVTSSTRVLATTTNALGNGTSYTRVFATICNPSATLVYLNMNGDTQASLGSGAYQTVIAASAGYDACYEITDRNLYQGAVQASSTNQTSVSVTVTDYVQ